MMINTTPSVAEVDAAMNLLSVLELAKDAEKLKAALKSIKDEQDAAANAKKAADAAAAEAKAQENATDKKLARLASEQAKLDVEADKIAKNAEQVTADQQAMVEQRNQFDAWMAAEREALAADKAKVESDRVANARRAEDLKTLEDAAARRQADADSAIKTADAKREEYESKLASLKAMVG